MENSNLSQKATGYYKDGYIWCDIVLAPTSNYANTGRHDMTSVLKEVSPTLFYFSQEEVSPNDTFYFYFPQELKLSF